MEQTARLMLVPSYILHYSSLVLQPTFAPKSLIDSKRQPVIQLRTLILIRSILGTIAQGWLVVELCWFECPLSVSSVHGLDCYSSNCDPSISNGSSPRSHARHRKDGSSANGSSADLIFLVQYRKGSVYRRIGFAQRRTDEY